MKKLSVLLVLILLNCSLGATRNNKGKRKKRVRKKAVLSPNQKLLQSASGLYQKGELFRAFRLLQRNEKELLNKKKELQLDKTENDLLSLLYTVRTALAIYYLRNNLHIRALAYVQPVVDEIDTDPTLLTNDETRHYTELLEYKVTRRNLTKSEAMALGTYLQCASTDVPRKQVRKYHELLIQQDVDPNNRFYSFLALSHDLRYAGKLERKQCFREAQKLGFNLAVHSVMGLIKRGKKQVETPESESYLGYSRDYLAPLLYPTAVLQEMVSSGDTSELYKATKKMPKKLKWFGVKPRYEDVAIELLSRLIDGANLMNGGKRVIIPQILSLYKTNADQLTRNKKIRGDDLLKLKLESIQAKAEYMEACIYKEGEDLCTCLTRIKSKLEDHLVSCKRNQKFNDIKYNRFFPLLVDVSVKLGGECLMKDQLPKAVECCQVIEKKRFSERENRLLQDRSYSPLDRAIKRGALKAAHEKRLQKIENAVYAAVAT